jgi:hypothetical protein
LRRRLSRPLAVALVLGGLGIVFAAWQWIATRSAGAACPAIAQLPDVVAASVRVGVPVPSLAILARDLSARDRLQELLRPEIGGVPVVIEAERETRSAEPEETAAVSSGEAFYASFFGENDPAFQKVRHEFHRFRKVLLALPGVTRVDIGSADAGGLGWSVDVDEETIPLVKAIVRDRVANVPLEFAVPW